MLTGDFSYKICPNNYECWHCVVDQYVQDSITSHPFLHKRKKRAVKQAKTVRGFALRTDFNYLPNHIWVKVEGETAKIGVDDFAARLIGDIKSIDLPGEQTVSRSAFCWQMGKDNRIARMSIPADIEIVERNQAVQSDPSLVKKDPYNEGWLLKIKTPKETLNMVSGDEAADWLDKEIESLFQEVGSNVDVMITDGGEIPGNFAQQLNDDQWRNFITRFLQK
jgi:glycine cleavage system H protein